MAEVFEKNAMILQEFVAEATDENNEIYILTTSVTSRAPIVKLPSGRYVTFSWDELIQLAIEAEKKTNKDCNPS
jgi:hypothetical protein